MYHVQEMYHEHVPKQELPIILLAPLTKDTILLSQHTLSY